MGYSRTWARRSTKKYVVPPPLVQAKVVWHDDGPELYIPIVVHAQHEYADAARAIQRKTNKEHMQMALHLLHVWLPDQGRINRSQVEWITYTRIAPSRGLAKHDNLRWALKHIVDITSYWMIDGRLMVPWRKIGDYDDKLEGQVTWDYQQRKEGKDWGVTVRLHKRPTSPKDMRES